MVSRLVRFALPHMRFLFVRPGVCPCRHFAASTSGFLQIPPHDGHPCLRLTVPTAKSVVDFHHQVIAHAGRTKKVRSANAGRTFLLFSNLDRTCSLLRFSRRKPAPFQGRSAGPPFSPMRNGGKNRLGRSPLRTSLGIPGWPCVKSMVGPSPLLWLLALPPHQATLVNWPYSQVVSTAGPT